jgi:putative ABC transport system permease protein
MEQVLSDSIAQPRLYTLLLGIFAGLAAVLASIGIYGVTSYLVGQREHEIGIRMAIGARNHEVVWDFVRRSLWWILAGIGIGMAASFGASRLLSSVLFEVKGTDPTTYVWVSASLLVLSLAAVFIPARRAIRVDPVVALRHD